MVECSIGDNSNICLNIISYFGSDPELRAKRVQYHNRQIDWAIERGYPIFINAMEYEDHEYRKHDLITYIKNPRMIASEARNILLKNFYSSNFDVGLFLDNDTILYPYYDHLKIFELLEDDVQQFIDENIFCFNPSYPRLDPVHGPNGTEKVNGEITIKYKDLHKRLQKEMDFKPHYMLQTACVFLINTKKYRDLEFYMDVNFTHKEDNDFGFQLQSQGLGVYKTFNIIMNEMGMNNSTMMEDREASLSEDEERRRRDVIANNALGAKWNSDNSGSFDKAAFKQRIGVNIGNNVKHIQKNKSKDDLFKW